MRGNCSGDGKSTEKKVVQSLFIYRFIDKQTIKKNNKNVNWCTNCLIVSHLFSHVYTTTIWTYNEVTFKITSSWKAFQIFFLFLLFMYSLHTISSGGLYVFLVFVFVTKVETIFVRLESTEGPLRRPLQLCEAFTGTAWDTEWQREREKDRKGYRSK